MSASAAIKEANFDQAIYIISEVEKIHSLGDYNPGEAELELIKILRKRCGIGEIKPELQKQCHSIPDWTETVRPGISLVTCAMNRTENLLKVLPTWLAIPTINEIIIVDWSSTTPVEDSLREASVRDSRIRLIRVLNEPRWVLSYAFNLGFRLAKFDKVLKVDADIMLKLDFFSKNQLTQGMFIAGNWEAAEKGQEHINGFFFVRHADLARVKGFNEYITTYGWDDDDIYNRLAEVGARRTLVDTKSIYHIPHDDSQRLGLNVQDANNAWEELRRNTLFNIRVNRYLAFVMPRWKSGCIGAPFRIRGERVGYVEVARDVTAMPHLVSDDIRRDAEIHAALELMSWRLGTSVYHLPKSVFSLLLEIKKLDEISLFDIDIGLVGGDALSHLKRYSVVVSIPDSLPNTMLAAAATWLNHTLADLPVGVFIEHGSQQADAFSKLLNVSNCVLPCSIRSSTLPVKALSDVQEFSAKALKGSGLRLKIDEALAFAVTSKASLPHIHIRKRRLYIDTQHGLGNRLRAYGSAAAIAKATDHELVVVWTPDHHCECRFSDLFDAPDVHVIESPSELPAAGVRRYTYMELEPGAIKDQPIELSNDSDTLVRSAYVLNHPSSNWERENAEIRALKPSRQVMQLVNSVDVRGCIGAHVRMEAGKGLDHNSYDSSANWSADSHAQIHFWRSKSHYSAFIRRIDALFAEQPTRRLFLATDLPENYDVFRRQYGERMCFLPRQVYDRSRLQIIYALADVILLSRCEMLLGSTWSSFSELAMRLSQKYKKCEESGKDF